MLLVGPLLARTDAVVLRENRDSDSHRGLPNLLTLE